MNRFKRDSGKDKEKDADHKKGPVPEVPEEEKKSSADAYRVRNKMLHQLGFSREGNPVATPLYVERSATILEGSKTPERPKEKTKRVSRATSFLERASTKQLVPDGTPCFGPTEEETTEGTEFPDEATQDEEIEETIEDDEEEEVDGLCLNYV